MRDASILASAIGLPSSATISAAMSSARSARRRAAAVRISARRVGVVRRHASAASLAASTAAVTSATRRLGRDRHDLASVGGVGALERRAVGRGDLGAADPVADRDRHRTSTAARCDGVGGDQLSHFEKSTGWPRCSRIAVTPALQQAMSSLVWPPLTPIAADDLAVDLDRPSADEDREPAAVHVHDAERLTARLGVGVGVRRAAVAGGGERLVDRRSRRSSAWRCRAA